MKIVVKKKCEYRADFAARRILPVGWRGGIPAKEARSLEKAGSVSIVGTEKQASAKGNAE